MEGIWPYVLAGLFGASVGLAVRWTRKLTSRRCPNCDEMIRRKAKVCPRCGRSTGWA